MTTTIKVPKSVECDKTIAAVLNDVVMRNKDCIALVKHEITPDEVLLTYDDEQCEKAGS